MLGLNILLHSVKLVLLNWKTAVRISSPLVATMLVFGVLFGGFDASIELENPTTNFPWTAFIMFIVAQVVAGLWVAVAWHRYVLLEEDTGSLVPRFVADRIGAYFVQGLLLAILVFIAALIIGTVVSIALSTLGGVAGVVLSMIVVTGLLLWLFYRVSPTLPAAALGEALSIGDAWRETKPFSGAIFVMVLAMSVVSALAGYLVETTLGISSGIYLIFTLIQTWVSLMVGISVLTTIYGVAVEKRDL